MSSYKQELDELFAAIHKLELRERAVLKNVSRITPHLVGWVGADAFIPGKLYGDFLSYLKSNNPVGFDLEYMEVSSLAVFLEFYGVCRENFF